MTLIFIPPPPETTQEIRRVVIEEVKQGRNSVLVNWRKPNRPQPLSNPASRKVSFAGGGAGSRRSTVRFSINSSQPRWSMVSK